MLRGKSECNTPQSNTPHCNTPTSVTQSSDFSHNVYKSLHIEVDDDESKGGDGRRRRHKRKIESKSDYKIESKGEVKNEDSGKLPTIIYIIGHRSADDFRKNNLLRTVNWLREVKKLYTALEIVVVEQDKSRTVQDILPNDVHYIFAFNDSYYNRGWGFNIGFRQFETQGDYFFFADNDIVLPIPNIVNLFTIANQYEAVNPYSHIFDTTELIESEYIPYYTGELPLVEMKSVTTERQDTCFSGGIVGLSKQAVYLISGWDERFYGRGWEDYAFTAKLFLFLCNVYTDPSNAIHMYHPFETSTTREPNKQLDIEYSTYTPAEYGTNIVYTSTQFGKLHKLDIEFNMNVDTILFPKRLKEAKKKYASTKQLVESKHTTNTLTFLYHNLSQIHDCTKH